MNKTIEIKFTRWGALLKREKEVTKDHAEQWKYYVNNLQVLFWSYERVDNDYENIFVKFKEFNVAKRLST